MWKDGTLLQTTGTTPPSAAASPVQFVDVARQAGLDAPNVWGGADRKSYIIEAKGSGLAFFDFDNDGCLDIYLTNNLRFRAAGAMPPRTCPSEGRFRRSRHFQGNALLFAVRQIRNVNRDR
jgi:hypothetical protein